MNASLPRGVSRAIVCDGSVFLNVEPDVAERGLALAVGENVARFEAGWDPEVEAPGSAEPIYPTLAANALIDRVEP